VPPGPVSLMCVSPPYRFTIAFGNQSKSAWLRDDHFVAELLEKPADPRRMRAAFHSDSHSAGPSEYRFECIRTGFHDTVADQSSRTIEDTIRAAFITEINAHNSNRIGVILWILWTKFDASFVLHMRCSVPNQFAGEGRSHLI
jgi:hypothetical protein